MKYFKLVKRTVPALCILMLLPVFFPVGTKAASSGMSVSYEAGIGGNIKMWKGFPIKFTLSNEGEEPFSGDLVVLFSGSYSSGGAKVLSVHLESGETKQYEISLPGISNNTLYSSSQDDQILLYEGSWRDGKRVAFEGNGRLIVNFINENASSVGLLSESPDRLRSFRGMEPDRMKWLSLTKENIPQDVLGFEIFDILIVDDFPISTLSEEQTNALTQWIERGGVLLIGTSPNAKQAYGSLYDLLPLKPEGEERIQRASLEISGSEAALENFLVVTGKVSKEDVLYSADDLPLMVEKEYGLGKVIQTSFSIGDKPNVDTAGYAEFFSRFLSTYDIPNSPSFEWYDRLNRFIGEYNEYFSDANISIFQLLLIFFIYLIVLVPVLYNVLKRMDKREHAWWLIPAISIFTSVLIFAYGAKDRIGQPLKNESGFFVVQNGHLNGLYAVSFQSNTSGDYELQFNKGELYPMLFTGDSFGYSQMSTGAYISEGRERVEVVFPEVEYWSIRSLLGRAYKRTEGAILAELAVEKQVLRGTVTNQFPYDFDEVFIWTGENRYETGTLRAGETKEIHVQLNDPWLEKPFPSGTDYADYQNMEESIKNRMFTDFGIYDLGIKDPVIAAITADPILDVDILKKNEKGKRLSMILQPFTAASDFSGEFQFTNEQLDVFAETVQGSSIESQHMGPATFNRIREVYLNQGIYQFHFQLPRGIQHSDWTVDEITIQLQQVELDQIYLIKYETGEKILLESPLVKLTEGASGFLAPDGRLTFEITKNNVEEPFLYLPDIEMKGRIGQ